jgi:monooxygenase
MNAHSPIDETVDMIIVGAGISGIGMAVHMKRDCPDKSVAILDRRENLGGFGYAHAGLRVRTLDP